MKNNMSEIGARIKSARKKNGISQAELADKLDISVSHLSNIENGKINVGLDIFIDIVNILDASADWLLNIDPESSYTKEIISILSDCNENESRAIVGIAKHVKAGLRCD